MWKLPEAIQLMKASKRISCLDPRCLCGIMRSHRKGWGDVDSQTPVLPMEPTSRSFGVDNWRTAKGGPWGSVLRQLYNSLLTPLPTFTQGGPNPSACCSVFASSACDFAPYGIASLGKPSLCSIWLISLRLCLWLTLFLHLQDYTN